MRVGRYDSCCSWPVVAATVYADAAERVAQVPMRDHGGERNVTRYPTGRIGLAWTNYGVEGEMAGW